MTTAAEPATYPAVWFDGRRAVRQAARVHCDKGAWLVVEVDGHANCHALADVAAGERWRHGPWPVGLPDGSTLWLDDTAQALIGALPQTRPWVRAWCASRLRLALVTLALVVVLLWLDRQGIGLFAQGALQVLPRAVDVHAGTVFMKHFDAAYLRESSISQQRQVAIRERFEAAAAQHAPGLKVRLIFRAHKDGNNFNAFAAPDGTICLLDGLTDKFTDDEVMAVLGHELGHVVHRHAMQRVAASIGFVALAGVVWGDVSSVATIGASTVKTLSHSRDAERQADAYARSFVAHVQLPPQVLLASWRKMSDEMQHAGAGTGADAPGWLATHPGIDDRIRAEQQYLDTIGAKQKEKQP
jgi:Zn-dependent protease with chaperone function